MQCCRFAAFQRTVAAIHYPSGRIIARVSSSEPVLQKSASPLMLKSGIYVGLVGTVTKNLMATKFISVADQIQRKQIYICTIDGRSFGYTVDNRHKGIGNVIQKFSPILVSQLAHDNNEQEQQLFSCATLE